MADPKWPNAPYVRRLLIVYASAALAAGIITFIALWFIYEPKGAMFGFVAFATGAVAGAATRYYSDKGTWIRIRERIYDAICHPARLTSS